jgi:MFS family permease
VFAAVAYAFLITMAGTTVPTPLYVLYRARFGFSEFMVTVIFATYAAGVIAALLLFGRLSDDVGRRRALVPGIALSALSAVAFLLAHGLALLLVGRFLSGLSAGIFTGAATAALVDLAPPEGDARATLAAAMANMGGLGLGPLLSGLLVEWAGLRLRLAFWVDLALLIPALGAVLLVPEPPAGQRRLRVRPQAIGVPSEIRPAFVRSALAGFAGFAVLGMFTAVSPAFLAGLLHERSHALLGVIVCVVFMSSTVGQLALNRVADSAALPLGCGGLILGTLAIALSLGLSSLALLVLGGIVAGFGQGLSFRAGLAALNAGAPAERRAEVASSFFVVAYVALSIPVIGVGILTQAAGLRVAGLAFTLAVAALAATVLVLVSAGDRARVTA